MKTLSILGAAAALAATASAQDLCEGNGFGEAYLEVGPAYLGGKFVHDMGSPNVPFSFCLFSISDGFNTTSHPAIGPVCLDITSSIYQVFNFPTDGNGNVHLELGLPNDAALLSLGPFYSNVATFESGGWSISKTVPLYFEFADSFSPVIGAMSAPRHFQTVTPLGQDPRDNRIKVLVAGGGQGTATVPTATMTTELYDPLSRTFSPGPDLAIERALHTATLLQDGRVLITGGMDSIGVCNKLCEVYDPVTQTFSPTGDMSTERADHTASLLADGRVLVVGGLQDYQNPGTAFAVALGTSQTTGEIWDPATGLWSPVGNEMQSKRSGHTATTLLDGTVAIVSGVNGGFSTGAFGGEAPSFTNTVDIYDPSSNTFIPGPNIPFGRGQHGASLLGDGSLLVCGGNVTSGSYGEAAASSGCFLMQGGSWSFTGNLPLPMAWHTMIEQDGEALVLGAITNPLSSLTGSSYVGIHDGTSITDLALQGTNPGIPGSSADNWGNVRAARIYDGSLLMLGGYSAGAVFDSGYVYTPNP